MNNEIDQAFIERLKARDNRFQLIDNAIQIEAELSNSFVIKAILQTLQEYAEKAIEEMMSADPTNTRLITSLQERVKIAKIVGNTLEEIRRKGAWAQKLVEEDDQIANTEGGVK